MIDDCSGVPHARGGAWGRLVVAEGGVGQFALWEIVEENERAGEVIRAVTISPSSDLYPGPPRVAVRRHGLVDRSSCRLVL